MFKVSVEKAVFALGLWERKELQFNLTVPVINLIGVVELPMNVHVWYVDYASLQLK